MRDTVGAMRKIRVALYARVSTDKQAELGMSLDAQKAELERYCRDRSWTIDGLYVDDGFSGKNGDCPEFQRMIRAISDGWIDGIVVTKLDRLTRSVRNLCEVNEDILRPQNVNLVCVRDGINTFEVGGTLLMHLLAIIGKIERENISQRTTATIAHIHDSGDQMGRDLARDEFGFGERYPHCGADLGPWPLPDRLLRGSAHHTSARGLHCHEVFQRQITQEGRGSGRFRQAARHGSRVCGQGERTARAGTSRSGGSSSASGFVAESYFPRAHPCCASQAADPDGRGSRTRTRLDEGQVASPTRAGSSTRRSGSSRFPTRRRYPGGRRGQGLRR